MAALLASFTISLLGTATNLALIGELAALDRFYLYCWMAGGLGLILGLSFCSMKKDFRLGGSILIAGIIAFAIPLLRFDNARTTMNRILRYLIFFTHLPASAVFGVLIAIAAYRWILEVSGE